jgi:hypothetical protein
MRFWQMLQPPEAMTSKKHYLENIETVRVTRFVDPRNACQSRSFQWTLKKLGSASPEKSMERDERILMEIGSLGDQTEGIVLNGFMPIGHKSSLIC